MAAESGKITAYRLKGEVLTKVQEQLFGSKGLSLLANDAVGIKRELSVFTDEQYFEQLQADNCVDGKEDYPTYLHGMDEVIESTEAQKRADEEALKNCLQEKEH